VVGVPGQVVKRSRPQEDLVDLHHDNLPDTIGVSLTAVMTRLDRLEKNLKTHQIEHPELVGAANGNGNGKESHGPHTPDDGIWRGEDFMI
jgi:serine O-acetyltransferase